MPAEGLCTPNEGLACAESAGASCLAEGVPLGEEDADQAQRGDGGEHESCRQFEGLREGVAEVGRIGGEHEREGGQDHGEGTDHHGCTDGCGAGGDGVEAEVEDHVAGFGAEHGDGPAGGDYGDEDGPESGEDVDGPEPDEDEPEQFEGEEDSGGQRVAHDECGDDEGEGDDELDAGVEVAEVAGSVDGAEEIGVHAFSFPLVVWGSEGSEASSASRVMDLPPSAAV